MSPGCLTNSGPQDGFASCMTLRMASMRSNNRTIFASAEKSPRKQPQQRRQRHTPSAEAPAQQAQIGKDRSGFGRHLLIDVSPILYVAEHMQFQTVHRSLNHGLRYYCSGLVRVLFAHSPASKHNRTDVGSRLVIDHIRPGISIQEARVQLPVPCSGCP